MQTSQPQKTKKPGDQSQKTWRFGENPGDFYRRRQKELNQA